MEFCFLVGVDDEGGASSFRVRFLLEEESIVLSFTDERRLLVLLLWRRDPTVGHAVLQVAVLSFRHGRGSRVEVSV